jgi:LmbE family N-acetylglucosaminyl deacetylase
MEQRRKRECAEAAREWATKPVHLDHAQRHYRDDDLRLVDLGYGVPVPACIRDDRPTILLAAEDEASIDRVKNLILERRPEIIFTHPLATYNPEHWGTAHLVANAFWKAREEGYRGALLQWLEPETRFGPFYHRWETFVDITAYSERKMELIGKHACQMPNAHLPGFGHRVLAAEYGKACGCGAAECFIWVERSAHRENRHPVYSSLMLDLLKNTR